MFVCVWDAFRKYSRKNRNMKSTNLVNFKIFVLDEFVLSGLISRVGIGEVAGDGVLWTDSADRAVSKL